MTCEQLAQNHYVTEEWLGVEHMTSSVHHQAVVMWCDLLISKECPYVILVARS